MQVQHEKSGPTKEILDRVAVETARERLRRARLEADEVEHRIGNRDQRERAEALVAKEEARAVRHENWRGWISMAIGIALFALPLAGVGSGPAAPSTPAAYLTSTPSSEDPVSRDPRMTKAPENGDEHPSSSKIHREVELVIVKRLARELGVALERRKVPYEGAKMEIDGVNPGQTIFVEAFARIGKLKSGQKRKVAADTLRFLALKAEHPHSRFILTFADQAAADSVVGWQRAVQDRHGIERVVVKLPKGAREKLLAAQAKNRKGMETGAG